jgi:hypothetical protein
MPVSFLRYLIFFPGEKLKSSDKSGRATKIRKEKLYCIGEVDKWKREKEKGTSMGEKRKNKDTKILFGLNLTHIWPMFQS